MGQNLSLPERIHKACSSDNHGEVRNIITELSRRSRADALSVLESRNSLKRTCLYVCSSKGAINCALLLLQNGVDVHATDPLTGCTAIHEAVLNKDERMVELLVTYGADPFRANAKGCTSMQLAALSGGTKIVQRFKRQAIFAGPVDIRWLRLGRLHNFYKPRHVVVIPYRPWSKEGIAPLPERRQLLIFGDEKASVPKTLAWLDGGSMIQAGGSLGSEAVLRLAPGHASLDGQPYTRLSEGRICLLFKMQGGDRLQPQARSFAVGSRAPAGPAGPAAWVQLLHACYLDPSLTLTNMEPFLGASPGSPVKSGVFQLVHAFQPQSSSSTTSARVNTNTARNVQSWSQPGDQHPASPYPYPYDLTTPSRMAASPLDRAPSHYQFSISDRGDTPASWVPAMHLDLEGARAGESDAEFAARLATVSLLMSEPSHIQYNSPPPPPPQSATSHSAQRTSSFNTAAAVVVSSGPSNQCPPSAPPLGPVRSVGRAASSEHGLSSHEDGGVCVICMDAPMTAGFLHGKTVHKCVCTGCSKGIRPGNLCPMCRVPVEAVLEVF
ncbi:hypothetical protein CEUSTIGMA_g6635.t1 [Chlamydomonas eustigma]|uniref:Uncharacterized protein n=1 Tax=Chlamydomonas eustigma TaxID=1157962 RepID=A0A250X7Z9_9CHLO|nr:hypothetical protein CEUSTIGMA_g6635.t1 [Chlamydomonas eustigma]|eukprot:GAX79195.1 hypothetical protein CEUSTIGMA_g6635.t1 [Chlamydomonas eustigma]